MLNTTKKFIEQNIDLLEQKSFRTFFLEAYAQSLTTAEMRELDEILRESGLFDSTQLRNDLLYELVEDNLKIAKNQDPAVKNRYLVQFLRYFLNNTFGFYEGEAVQMIYDNQKNLGILLSPTNQTLGQSGFKNYIINFED